MGCRTLELNDGRAILHCSTSETVFGPIFDDEDQATEFVIWVRKVYNADPRGKTALQLEQLRHAFLLEMAQAHETAGDVDAE